MMRYEACCCDYVNVFIIMHVCGCAVGGQVFVTGMDSGCVLYLVRVTGSVVGLAVFGVCVLYIIFKETCLIICTYLCTGWSRKK